jgi:uncharacterized protein YecE (DUF72 family)
MKESEPGHGTIDQATFLIGTSGWTYDHWKGCFYPKGLPKSRWLDYYSSRFSTVEVNATFYRTFKDQTYLNWKARAPVGFGYVLKAPRGITHRKYLMNVEEDIKNFCRSSAHLGDRLEMTLLQVAPNTPYDLERLQKALVAFHDPGRVAVEFRNSRWLTPATEELLRSVGATFCNADSPDQQLTSILTSSQAYLRLHGRRHWYADNYSSEELREIADRARELAARGATQVYIFFNNDFEGNAPANALFLLKLLRA